MPIYRIAQKTILFIHVPKAGGTSVGRWLAAHSPESFHVGNGVLPEFPCVAQHFHGEVFDKLFAEDFFEYRFCIVRNPYARIVSEYNYRLIEARRREKILMSAGFAAWFKLTQMRYGQTPYVLSNHIRPQSDFPTPTTEVFRLEDQLDDLKRRLSEVTGLALDEPIEHRNPSKLSKARLTEPLAKKIHDFYAADFERFGYDPKSWTQFA
jgi:hypothetical protein